MNDALDAALIHIDTVEYLRSYDAVAVAVDHARALDGAAGVELGLLARLLGAATRHRQPVEVVERHLQDYLAAVPNDDVDELWRRAHKVAAAVVDYPELSAYLERERQRLAAEAPSALRDDLIALTDSVLKRISSGR